MDVGMNKDEIPTDPTQRWEWIKYQLRVSDNSLAKLSLQLGVTTPAVKNAKRTPYPRVERAIAAALGLEPFDIWPERWGSNGKPLRQRPQRSESYTKSVKQNSGCYAQGHRKTGTEA